MLHSMEVGIILQGGCSNTSELLLNQTKYKTKCYNQNFILNTLGAIIAMQKDLICILPRLSPQMTGLEPEAQGWLRGSWNPWSHMASF